MTLMGGAAASETLIGGYTYLHNRGVQHPPKQPRENTDYNRTNTSQSQCNDTRTYIPQVVTSPFRTSTKKCSLACQPIPLYCYYCTIYVVLLVIRRDGWTVVACKTVRWLLVLYAESFRKSYISFWVDLVHFRRWVKLWFYLAALIDVKLARIENYKSLTETMTWHQTNNRWIFVSSNQH